MTEGAKLVTGKPDTTEVVRKTGDTKRPIALVGVSHQHLDSQESEENNCDKNEVEKKS